MRNVLARLLADRERSLLVLVSGSLAGVAGGGGGGGGKLGLVVDEPDAARPGGGAGARAGDVPKIKEILKSIKDCRVKLMHFIAN